MFDEMLDNFELLWGLMRWKSIILDNLLFEKDLEILKEVELLIFLDSFYVIEVEFLDELISEESENEVYDMFEVEFFVF